MRSGRKRNTNERIISSLANFIDKFEDATQELRNKLGRRLIKDTAAEKDMLERHNISGPKTEYCKNVFAYTDTNKKLFGLITEKYDVYKSCSAKYLGKGMSGYVYTLTYGYIKFVIKETQKNHQKDIEHEFEELKKVVDMPNMQQGVALMKTRDGGTFLISEFQPGIPKGLNKKNGTKTFNPLTSNNIRDFLNVLSDLDKKMLFNPDLNLGNILYDNEVPTIIDLEWQTNMNNAEKVFTFMPNEKKTNMVAFESSGLSAYIKDLYKTNKNIKLSYMNNKKSCRDFLKMYFMERAKHCDTSNRFERIRKAVYQNPSEDVLDAEILRLSILKNQEKQFTYLDKNIEKPRDMLKMIRYQARANFAAKMLSEFQPQKPANQISDDEKKYFEEMRNFGKEWHQKTQEWYKGSIEWMKKLVSREEYQNNNTGYFYFPEKFGKGDKKEQNARDSAVSDKTMLSDVLSGGASGQYTRSFKKIRSKITELEDNFMDLKQAVYKNDNVSKNDAKEDIEDLISKVLV